MPKKRKTPPRAASLSFGQKVMHVFLGLCTLMIVTTLMMPQTFGFQDFRQWAGMYIDNWCQLTAYSGLPGAPDTKVEHGVVGKMGVSQPVWTSPSHNELSCAHWAKEMVCGRPTSGGWTAVYVRPYFNQEKYYLGDLNICEYTFTSDLPWFTYE